MRPPSKTLVHPSIPILPDRNTSPSKYIIHNVRGRQRNQRRRHKFFTGAHCTQEQVLHRHNNRRRSSINGFSFYFFFQCHSRRRFGSATAAAAPLLSPSETEPTSVQSQPRQERGQTPVRRVRNSTNALQQVEISRFDDHNCRHLVVFVSFLASLASLANRIILLDYHGYLPFQRQEPPGVVPVDQELHAERGRRRYPSAPDQQDHPGSGLLGFVLVFVVGGLGGIRSRSVHHRRCQQPGCRGLRGGTVRPCPQSVLGGQLAA